MKMKEKVMSPSQRRGKEGRKEGRKEKKKWARWKQSTKDGKIEFEKVMGATGVENKHSLVAIQKKHRRSGAFSETMHPQRHTSGVCALWTSQILRGSRVSFKLNPSRFIFAPEKEGTLGHGDLHPSLASISSTEPFDHRHKGKDGAPKKTTSPEMCGDKVSGWENARKSS